MTLSPKESQEAARARVVQVMYLRMVGMCLACLLGLAISFLGQPDLSLLHHDFPKQQWRRL